MNDEMVIRAGNVAINPDDGRPSETADATAVTIHLKFN